jgi:hypothetical protein
VRLDPKSQAKLAAYTGGIAHSQGMRPTGGLAAPVVITGMLGNLATMPNLAP